MALGGQHVLAFSSDGKLFALINDQGILRIWDAETNELKQEYTPNLHLAGPCTALTWLSVSSASTPQEKKVKKARKSGIKENQLYLALGTSNGHVSLYSYTQGKIERNLQGEGHNGKITAIARDNAGHLFTCGEDCQIVVWSVQEERQLTAWSIGSDKPYSIAYMPYSNSLVIGARQIKVYAVDTQELVQTFTGHTSEVNLMSSFVVNESVEYALTTSRMERIICLWKIGKKGRNKTAACTFLMEDIAHCIACQIIDEDGNLKVASVTRSGVIHMYLIAIDSIKAEKPIKPKITIEIASDSDTVIAPIPAVAVTLQHSYPTQDILFGYGDKHFMVFEHITPNFVEKMQVLIRAEPKKLFAGNKTSKKDSSTASSALLKTVTPIVNKEDVDYKSTLTASRKKLKPTEMPMESRLQNLNLNTGSTATQSQSKVQLLVQALHSKDAALLRSVLCTDDKKTIQLTLQRLPVQYVGALVNELTLLMQKKRMNVEFSINWLQILTQTHSSQLMALGSQDLLNKFGPCIGIIEHRVNCLKELSKLNGRLQLLVSQIKRNAEEDNLNNENVLVYEDNDDSSNSEIEDTAEKSTSDGEWDEDADDDDDDENNDDDDDDEDVEMKT